MVQTYELSQCIAATSFVGGRPVRAIREIVAFLRRTVNRLLALLDWSVYQIGPDANEIEKSELVVHCEQLMNGNAPFIPAHSCGGSQNR